MNLRHNHPRRSAGASLVAVLWLVGVLGLSLLGVAKFVALDSRWASTLRKTSEARTMAENGVALASHPGIERGDPLLSHHDKATEAGYEVRVTWEEGLVPINQILHSGQKDLLNRLFTAWGLEPDSAAALVDALSDWVDEDDLVSLNGAESDAYAHAGREGFPLNRPFESLDEIEWVMGMEEMARLKPDWKSFLTIWSNGQIDLNEADADVVYAALGLNDPVRAREFVRQRLGEDGIYGTPDDSTFQSLESVFQFFGLTPSSANRLLAVRGTTKRILSTGSYQGATVQISETRRANLLLWRTVH